MADREDQVYQAKLAEQAERYDGKFHIFVIFYRGCGLLAHPWCTELCTFQYHYVLPGTSR